MNKFIIFFPYERIKKYQVNSQYSISSKSFQFLQVNDVIYLAKVKNNYHIMSSYGYCFNCAYQTWDIGKNIKKYCVQMIHKKFRVIKIIKKNDDIELVLHMIKKFISPKPLLDFQYRFLNKQFLKIDD